MENAGGAMTTTMPVQAPDISIESGTAEVIEGSSEPIFEQETPEFNPFEPQIAQEPQNEDEEDIFEPEVNDEDVELDRAREELEEVKEEESDDDLEEENNIEDELALINETIRLLEIQRDAIKEQLGGGLMTFFARLADYFFAETLMDKPSLVENSPIGQPTEAWKEDARFQLRTLETKIAELKQLRNRLVAKNKS